MKVRLLFLLLLAASLPSWGQANKCRLGFGIQTSGSPAWGENRPIVSYVEPYGSAALGGIKVGDIVEAINGVATHGLSVDQVYELLHTPEPVHTITVTSLAYRSKALFLQPDCISPEAISERELAKLFSLYSLEDSNTHLIPYPLHYTQSGAIDLSKVRTFSIVGEDAGHATDQAIGQVLRLSLQKRGLREDTQNADIFFSTYYQLEALEGANADKSLVWRYDPSTRDLKPLPIASQADPSAKYKLTYGIQAQNKPGGAIVWSCEAVEWLSSDMTLINYARYATEVMMLGYPIAPRAMPTLRVQTLRYHYTGLQLSRISLGRIVDVDADSPAIRAGLLPGDKIRSINGIKLSDIPANELLKSYYKWAERTDRYRDQSTPALSTLANGISEHYWSSADYPSIAESITRSGSEAAFSYLFSFRPYITPSGRDALSFEVERGGQKYVVQVTPQLRDESIIYFQ